MLTKFGKFKLKGITAKGRRSRRGFSVFETMLTMFIVVTAINEGYRLLETERSRIQNRLEIDRVVELADLGERFVRRDMAAVLDNLRAQPGYRLELTADDLEDTGLVMADAVTLLTPLRREVELWLYAPGGGSSLMVLARAHGDVTRVNIPGSVASTGPVGFVSPVFPTKVQGIGLDWDVSAYQAAWGWPAENDLVAVRYLDFDADIRPYLHRQDLTMNGIDLNQMATDIDMGGHSISGVGAFTANTVNATTVVADTVSVGSTLQTDQMTVTDTLTVLGDLTGGDAAFLNGVTADTATITTTLRAGNIDVAGAITGTSGAINGLLSAGSIAATGDISGADAVLSGAVNTNVLSVNSLTANELAVDGTIVGTSALIESIRTGSCTGC